MTSLILVDDHIIVRSGLKSLIQEMGNYTVTHEYSNGRLFLEALPHISAPDVVIMDLGMPEMDGEETMRIMHQHYPQHRVLILTWDTNERKIIELFRLGVRGYLLKSCTADTLKQAIDDTCKSGYYHSELLQSAINNNAGQSSYENDERLQVERKITARERQFLELVCNREEYTYDQMADLLKVHRRTVDGYRESLFEKFNLKSKTGLVLFAIKHGIVRL